MTGARDMGQEGAEGSRGFIRSFSCHLYTCNLLRMDESCATGTIDALGETFKRRINDFCSYTTNICLF